MKKKLSITLMVLSGVVALVGAGTLGGTYGSYSNYQTLTNMKNTIDGDPSFLKNSPVLQNIASQYDFSVDKISPSGWNEKYWGWSDSDKETQNYNLQQQKNSFYNKYPTYEDYQNAFVSQLNGQSGSSSSAINPLYFIYSMETYSLYTSLYSLNYNFDASQGGMIAGVVVLIVGLIAFIVMLAFILEEKKKKNKEAKKLEETIDTSNM